MAVPIEYKIFDLCPNPTIIINNNGIIIKANPASATILKYLGVDTGEYLSSYWLQYFLSPRPKQKKDIKINTGSFVYSFKIISEQEYHILFAEDITSIFITGKKLQDIDERYRLLANNAKDIISRHNLDGVILYISPSCKNYLGYDPEDLLGKCITDFVHQEDLHKVKDSFHHLRNEPETSITITFRIQSSDLHYLWFELVLKRIPKKSPTQFDEIISVAREISERKKMEDALKTSEELYKSVANNLSEGLVTLDLQGRINFINAAMENIAETNKENVIGKNVSDFLSSKESVLIKQKIIDRKNGISETYQFFTQLPNGKGKWLEIKSAPYPDAQGKIKGSISSITDITVKKRQEEEIAKLSMVASKTDNGIVITNANGLVEWINDSFTKISGYSLDEIKGKKPGDLLQGPGTDPVSIQDLKEKLATGKTFDILLLNYTKFKKPYWVQIEITPVKDEAGNIISYFSIQKDATEKIHTLELLKESEQRYKDLLSASFEGIVVHDNNIILDCNLRFSEMLGYAYKEILGSNLQKYLPNDTHDKFSIDATLDSSYEFVASCKNGTSLPVEIITKKHVYKNSTVRVTIIKDVSERIKTLQKLRESESRYRDLVETASNFIYTTDPKGNFLYINSVGIRKMEYSLEEFKQMNSKDVLPESWKEKVADFYQNQFTNKIKESYFEFPVLTKSGRELWLGQNVQMIEEDGWITAFNCYSRDITERKIIELELDRQKDLLKIILDTLPISIFLKNNNGEFLFVNNEAKQHEEKNFLISEDKIEIPLENGAGEVLTTEEKVVVNEVEKYVLLGRKKIQSELFKQPLTLGYFIDITDRKRVEEALRFAKQKAEDSMLAKERFISIMSHEIRTPMNAVVGITNLLIQQSHTEEQKEYLHALKTSSDNLLKILNNVLDLSKLESGKITFENINFDVREILSEIQETFKFKAAEKNIEIKNVISSFIPQFLKGDSLRLHQILVNLVSNALKFTHEGRITIEVGILDENDNKYHLIFSVSDTGIGIPEEKFMEIFESFTQVSSDISRKFGGTGLGLTITKRLIELQGGSIRVESQLDKGSKFIFDLFFDKSNQIAEATDMVFQYDLKGIKLLLVEDNEMNQLVVKKFLEKEKIEITLAENGRKATELYDQQTFDIILMDLQMPEMDGYEATKYIRKNKKNNTQIPIIALTASSSADIEQKIKKAGMSDIITKPFKPAKLYSMIAKYVLKEAPPSKTDFATLLQEKNHLPTMSYKYINLAYLKEASNGNVPFIKNMIEIFLKQTPAYLKELNDTYEAKEWEKFRKIIHKMKPTIPMMGISLQSEVAEIEDSAKQMINLDKLPALLKKLTKACEDSYEELRTELKNLD